MKLSNPRNDKPRFEIPGRGPLVAAAGILALLVLAGLLSRPPIPPSAQPAPPPVSRTAPTPEPSPAAVPEPSQPPGPTPGCVIKGNISQRGGGRIYHLPGQSYYDETVISPEKGERWFCTEKEALAAGWRKARR